MPKREVLAYIENLLPTYDRARQLCENYLIHVGWWMQVVPRDQLFEELLPRLYGVQSQNSSDGSSPSSSTESSNDKNEPDLKEGEWGVNALDEHELAAFLIVLALGILGELELAPANAEAETYVQCGRAMLNLKSVLEKTNLVTVQVLCLLGTYDLFAIRKQKLETTWRTISLGLMIATSVSCSDIFQTF